jgi:hypothetical protein
MKHTIKSYNWKTGDPVKNFEIVTEKEFSKPFSKKALKWFSDTCIKKYRLNGRLLDESLAGFHYEIGDMVIELH